MLILTCPPHLHSKLSIVNFRSNFFPTLHPFFVYLFHANPQIFYQPRSPNMVVKCVKCGLIGKGLFSIPKEERIAAEWFAILQVVKEDVKSYNRVCFKHFSKQDYYMEVSQFVLRKGAKPLGPGDYSSGVQGPLEAARAVLPKDTRIVVLPRVRRLECQVVHCGAELSMFVSVVICKINFFLTVLNSLCIVFPDRGASYCQGFNIHQQGLCILSIGQPITSATERNFLSTKS